MVAYYNENNPHAATVLENLIAGGHIAPGLVDRRAARRGVHKSMHVAYDVECFPNLFTVCIIPMHDLNTVWVYEISERRDDTWLLYRDLTNDTYTRMYGYNNMGYDYPMLHYFIMLCRTWGNRVTRDWLLESLYIENQRLIATPWDQRWNSHVWASEHHVEQCDLLMLNHFDNVAKLTSLKELQFNIESPNLLECPIPFGSVVGVEDIPVVIDYNVNDTRSTGNFAHLCMDAIKFREGMIAKGTFGPECLNWNDGKIGTKFFIKRMEAREPGITKRKPTRRAFVHIGDVVFPYIGFERPELKELESDLKSTVVPGHKTKDAYKFIVPLEDIDVHIGAGGIHASRNLYTASATTETCIIDIDVTGYYPSVAIVNGLSPEHLGTIFVDVYRTVRDDRADAKRSGDIVEAGTLKLSNNYVFGNTNNQHSIFLDPKCMLAITVNGQLLQLMLAEALLRVPGCRLLQLNTDGLTVELPRHQREMFDAVCAWWQRFTCLELEFTEYANLWLRDVNNYLALDTKGKIKRKGDYDHEMVSGSIGGQKAWNKDFSALVVPKAAEMALIHDVDPAGFIADHEKAYDFLLRKRVKKNMWLEGGHTGANLGHLVRYYIATDGEPIVKIMPPLKGKTENRRQGIHAEGQAVAVGSRTKWQCSMCGKQFALATDFAKHNRDRHAWPARIKMKWDGDLTGLDQRWYVQQSEKLIF